MRILKFVNLKIVKFAFSIYGSNDSQNAAFGV